MQRAVLNNVSRFKNFLQRADLAVAPNGSKKAYPILVNYHTGSMRIAQKIGKVDGQVMRLIAENKKGKIHFHLNDELGKQAKPSLFDPVAWKIVSDTLKAMDAMIRKTLGVNPTEIPGWIQGMPNRIAAERMLFGKRKGTYFISEGDEIIQDIARRLSEANGVFVRAYLLRVVEKENKISDILLIYTEWGWTIFADDPILNCAVYQYYSTLKALLHEIRHRAVKPL